MSESSSKKSRNQSSDPSDTGGKSNIPPKGEKEQKKEGEFRNVETSVNSPESFDDDPGSQKKDEMARQEARTEINERTGKS